MRRFVSPTVLAAVAALAGTGVAVASGSPDGGTATRAAASTFGVTGYVMLGGASEAKNVRRAAPTVTDYGIDGATLVGDAPTVQVPSQAVTLLEAAHAVGRPASLLLNNYDDQLGDFSPALAALALQDPARRAGVVEGLREAVTADGWDGVTVDLESLEAADRAPLVAFVAELRDALPAATTIDIDVPAGTDPTDDFLVPFDLPGLSAHVDHITLMAYDQHYAGGTAGPIAGLAWFRTVVAEATAQVPARQLRIGIAGYGYRWRKGKTTQDLTVRQAGQLAGKRARWNAKQNEWTARLRDGSVLWWSDARSVKRRTALAKAAGAGGIAVWRLGSADPLPKLPTSTAAPTPAPSPPGTTPVPTPTTPRCPGTASASADPTVVCPLIVGTTPSCSCPGPVR